MIARWVRGSGPAVAGRRRSRALLVAVWAIGGSTIGGCSTASPSPAPEAGMAGPDAGLDAGGTGGAAAGGNGGAAADGSAGTAADGSAGAAAGGTGAAAAGGTGAAAAGGTGAAAAGGAAGTAAGGNGGAGGSAGGAGGAGASIADGGIVLPSPWPGDNTVVIQDSLDQFPSNLSGFSYEPASGGQPDILWAIDNGPSTLYRLLFDGSTWNSSTTDGWGAGKSLHFPDGTGDPDSEGVTRAEFTSPAIYVSIERDNDAGKISRLSVLRYDTSTADSVLTATAEWNLTADLPVSDPNLGLEAITWVPDSALVAGRFYDESAGAPYDPTLYANHGTGLFFVGLESNGSIYGYALDQDSGGFQRVATIVSGQISIMDLSFDRDVGDLWAYCDNTCGNIASVFGFGGDGRLQLRRVYERPTGLPDSNNEGIGIAPESECAGGLKSFYWADDDDLNGHAIRRGDIPCGSLF
jgi:hypothetical protein